MTELPLSKSASLELWLAKAFWRIQYNTNQVFNTLQQNNKCRSKYIYEAVISINTYQVKQVY